MLEDEERIGQADSDEAEAAGPLARARAQRREGRPAEAVHLLEALVQREPDNAAAFQELAAALCDLNHHGPAGQAARRALELDPQLHRPHAVLAWIAVKEDRNREALEALQAQLEAMPPDERQHRALVHNQVGFVHFRQKRYQEAETAWQESRSLNPLDPLPRFNLALLYLTIKRPDQAATELEQLLSLPTVSEGIALAAHRHLGQLYARQGRYREAREQFERALELRVSFPDRLYRALPLLARYPTYLLIALLLLIVIIVWNLFLRR